MAPRLRSHLQVAALQRHAESLGLMFAVLDRGHDEGGLIYVKWVEGRDALLLTERAVSDQRRWVQIAAGFEAEVNAKIASERDFDPDLWAVEIMGSRQHTKTVLDPLPGY